jgi:streptogramin lyase
VGGSEILRFDPRSQKFVTIEDDHGPYDIALGPGALWISELSTVSRLDPTTNVITGSADVGVLLQDDFTSVAVGEGSIWLAKGGSGNVWRVDPATTKAVGSTVIGRHAGALAAGEGGVWVVRPDVGVVVRLDPRSGRVVKSIAVGRGLTRVTTGSGLVWVSTVPPGAGHVGGF